MFPPETATYESNILFTLRFMIDAKLVGMNWVEIPAGKYTLRQMHEQDSCCQYELDVHYKDIISHPPEGAMSNIAPLRILSFDIECAGRKGIFPEAKTDPVIQIANMVTRQGTILLVLCVLSMVTFHLRRIPTVHPQRLYPQYVFQYRWLASTILQPRRRDAV
jgi:DNA polymerase elongation subunit (family B)